MKKDTILPRGIDQSPIYEYRQDHERSRILMQLFMEHHYHPVNTSMIDFFDSYKPWLSSTDMQAIYRLVDKEGESLMLRSDITLFLAKKIGMQLTNYTLPLRICYSDSILQDIGDYDTGRNISLQSGVEIIGLDNNEGERECILLLNEALEKLGDAETVLHIGSRLLADQIAAGNPDIYTAIQERIPLSSLPIKENKQTLRALESLFSFIGDSNVFRDLVAEIRSILPPSISAEAESLIRIVDSLKNNSVHKRIHIDPSEIGRRAYYTGFVFSAYNTHSEQAVAQGGRYDKLITSFSKQDVSAVGFSIYPQKIPGTAPVSTTLSRTTSAAIGKNRLTIAIPKGRIYDQCLRHFSSCSLDIRMPERGFMIVNEELNICIIQVKNKDIPTYIQNGIAHLGIAGSDVLIESNCSFFSLSTLPFGSAKLCLAAKKGTSPLPNPDYPQRIATKYPSITRNYFHKKGIAVDIITLSGAIELAPVLELAPYIVDLVETGKTLAAHKLEIIETLLTTEVQVVANRAMYKVYYRAVDNLVRHIGGK